MKTPLAEFPIVSTRDADHAQQILSRELAELRFDSVRHKNQFKLQMNGTRLNKCLIAYNHFQTETQVNAGVLQDALILSLPEGNPTHVEIDGQRIDPNAGVAISPDRRLNIHRSAGSGVYFIRIGYEEVRSALTEMTDRLPRGKICFDPNVNLRTGCGAQIAKLIRHFVSDSQCGAGIANNAILKASFDELLLNAILQLPHNFQRMIDDHPAISSGLDVVRRAEDFMAAHANSPLTISDVVAECGCSRRSLFNAFQRHREYSPMKFLMNQRLQQAHQILTASEQPASVRSVAANCGFIHFGRFASAYRKQFGENPSVTLQRRHDGLQD